MQTVPCLRIDRMSAAEKRAYILADNKIALNAGWDEELLALELKELSASDLDFDILPILLTMFRSMAMLAATERYRGGEPRPA